MSYEPSLPRLRDQVDNANAWHAYATTGPTNDLNDVGNDMNDGHHRPNDSVFH